MYVTYQMVHTCTNKFDFPVVSAAPPDGHLRLVGSDFNAEGRVEIYHQKKWGTICDDWWGVEEAHVTCKQLGYRLGAQYWYSNAYFGQGNGTIWLDDVTCFGNETKLMNCRHNGWGGHNCRHYEDVAVVCRMEGTSKLRNFWLNKLQNCMSLSLCMYLYQAPTWLSFFMPITSRVRTFWAATQSKLDNTFIRLVLNYIHDRQKKLYKYIYLFIYLFIYLHLIRPGAEIILRFSS